MTELISRDALLAAIQAGSGEIGDVLVQIEHAPAVTPEVYINVTGGVADSVAATHRVGVNILDYDITPGEDRNYQVDPDGDEVWIYGDVPVVDPAKCAEIDAWPTAGDDECDGCGDTPPGGLDMGYCDTCLDNDRSGEND
jgi:hypothetical protein